MLTAILQILPLILVLLFGFGLKLGNLMTTDDGSTLLKLVFFAGAPPLIFLSVLKVNLNASFIALCLLAPAIVGITLLAGYALRRSALRRINVKTFGAILIGSVIMNTGFLLPFVQQLFGAEGLARLAVIDAINGIVTFSLVYAVAVRLGNEKTDSSFIAKKLLIAPPLWALILAIAFKLSGAVPPAFVNQAFAVMAALVSPVILLALGLKFTLRIRQPKLLTVPLILRFVLGGAIGLLFINLFSLHGLSAQIAMLASLAPIGFNSITFSELENLDTPFAASQVSLALLIAIIATPFLIPLIAHL